MFSQSMAVLCLVIALIDLIGGITMIVAMFKGINKLIYWGLGVAAGSMLVNWVIINIMAVLQAHGRL